MMERSSQCLRRIFPQVDCKDTCRVIWYRLCSSYPWLVCGSFFLRCCCIGSNWFARSCWKQGSVKGPRVHGVPEEDSLKHLECIVQLVVKYRARKNSVRISAPASFLLFRELVVPMVWESYRVQRFVCCLPIRILRFCEAPVLFWNTAYSGADGFVYLVLTASMGIRHCTERRSRSKDFGCPASFSWNRHLSILHRWPSKVSHDGTDFGCDGHVLVDSGVLMTNCRKL